MPSSTPAPAKPEAAAPKAAAPVVLEAGLNRNELPGGVAVEDLRFGTGRDFDASTVLYIARYRTILKATSEEIDSTARRTGEPTIFFVGQTVDGLKQGLMGMKMGGKRRVTVPGGLAFGEAGVKDKGGKVVIPANAEMIFEVELENVFGMTEEIQGGGEEIKDDTRFLVTYRGTLASDGTEFDSNIGKGKPATFSLGGLISGWRVGLQGAKVGCKRRMVIPWQLAYGEAGSPPKIPGKADLVFDVEIVGIEPPPTPMPPTPGTIGAPIQIKPPTITTTPAPAPTPTPVPPPAPAPK
ncbi:MAG: FKBP-type peptidyl-prolyl cis-trans isomerase [Phycisphaerales bacterium]|nr:FKBP-type peptidyl-prolyl cis-trans isomerase [Phycisphaerales bacterium]